MSTLIIRVPGEIRGKGRPKFSTRGGFARAYTDTKTANAETWVRACAVDQVGQPVLSGPLSVVMTITTGIPASWSKRKRTAAAAGIVCPTGKPDLDNTAKLVTDSLNGIVWRDDSQIVWLVVSKQYGPEPGAVLQVTQLNGKEAAA